MSRDTRSTLMLWLLALVVILLTAYVEGAPPGTDLDCPPGSTKVLDWRGWPECR